MKMYRDYFDSKRVSDEKISFNRVKANDTVRYFAIISQRRVILNWLAIGRVIADCIL